MEKGDRAGRRTANAATIRRPADGLLDAGLPEDFGGHTDLAPGGTVDAATIAERLRHSDEVLLELIAIGGVALEQLVGGVLQLGLLVEEVETLERVALRGELLLDLLETGVDGTDVLHRRLAATLGLVVLQVRQVRLDGTRLVATIPERIEVLLGDLSLGLRVGTQGISLPIYCSWVSGGFQILAACFGAR